MAMSASTAIKDRLKDLNMTQMELAKKLGISRQNLTNKMTRDNFSTKELCQIGEILNFSLVLKADKEYVIEYPR
ncbi:MAG: helix-turn-helix transcriptional regulator [Ruminococcus sp.]|nr:helix-turn-helix transcriptional regulator [Ruminococcus sp.]